MTTKMDTVRWGILGPGNIAKKFAEGLRSAAGAQLVAVGSRSRENAEKFGAQFNVPRRHASYQALVEDKDVDVIYVATPHSLHMEATLLCLQAGKAVLCEKPFAINAAQAETMVRAARDRKCFLMEAMWARFLPHVRELDRLLKDRAVGEPRMLAADFGFRANVNPQGRLFNPQLGGGGLLDVGVYPVSLSSMVFGRPRRIVSLAQLGSTGVDEQAAMILSHDGGQLAVLYTAIRTTTPHDATVLGAEGSIRILSPWWRPSHLAIKKGGKEERIEVPAQGNGYNYQAEDVMNCLRQGKTESAVMPLEESVSVMKTLDEIRGQWGLKYPME